MEKIKEVNINTYMPILIEQIQLGKDVNLLISGNSMSPFLVHHRDTIIISKPDKPLKKGKMVFYIRENGQYVMHRIHHIKNNELYIVGDGQREIEGPIQQKQVFGIINKAIRKGKLIQKGDFWWNFFEIIWIRIVPLRKIIYKVFVTLKRISII